MNPARATTTDYTNLAPAQGRISVASLGAPKVQAALNAGSDYLDGLLVDQATLPLIPPYPQDVVDFEVVYAAYRLLLNVGFNPQAPADMAVKEEYDRKMSWAREIAAGEITPNWTDSSSDQDMGGPFVITSAQRGLSERGINVRNPPAPQVDPYTGD
jgi:phage gp36-like protein